MTLKDVALTISECATGSNGEMTDAQIIDRAEFQLVDIVYEWFLEDPAFMVETEVGNVALNINQQQLEAIRRIVARAMLRQHQYEVELMADPA